MPNLRQAMMGAAGVTEEALTNHKIYSWGLASEGSLGHGNYTGLSSPVQIGSLETWKLVAQANYTAFGIMTDGTLWSWGSFQNGTDGREDTVNRNSPVQVGSLTDWSNISGNYQAGAVKTDGTLWTWGKNDKGQLGLGNTTNTSSPTQVGSLTDWSSVSATAFETTHAIKTDGTLWSWGDGTYDLPDGTTTDRSSPVQIGSDTNWAQVVGGHYASLARRTDGTIWGWGYGPYNLLPNPLDGATYSSPVQIGSATNWVDISGSYRTGHAINSDGELYGWGKNASGQVGNGAISTVNAVTQIGSLTNWASVMTGGGSASHVMSRKTDGTLWNWGANGSGGLGDGSTINRSSPVQIGSLTTWGESPLYSIGGTLASPFGLATQVLG